MSRNIVQIIEIRRFDKTDKKKKKKKEIFKLRSELRSQSKYAHVKKLIAFYDALLQMILIL